MVLPTPNGGINLRIPKKAAVVALTALLGAVAGGGGALLWSKLNQPSPEEVTRAVEMMALQVDLAELERDLVDLRQQIAERQEMDLNTGVYEERLDTLVGQVARIRGQVDGLLMRESRDDSEGEGD